MRKALKVLLQTKLGFHGNVVINLNLALSNSIAAIKSGVDIIDSTLGGLGRGAENLRTKTNTCAKYILWKDGREYSYDYV